MTIKHTLTIVLSSLFVSGVAYAAGAPPANVRNVQGLIADGQLTVTWDAPTDAANVTSYRIYYSHQSILGNDGNYDDFDQTESAVNSYTFKELPLRSPVIFIGVLAVGKDGIESEGFEVEASIPVPADLVQPMSSSSVPAESSSSSSAVPSLPPLTITTAEAKGSTGVLLTFNKALSATTPLMPVHFQLSDTGGTLIPIFSVTQQDGVHVLLITSAHRPDTTYIVRIMVPVAAQDGSATEPDTELLFRSDVAAVTAVPPVTTPVIPPVPEPDPAEGEYGRNPALPPPAPVATIIPVTVNPDERKTDLPDSGLGLLGVLVTAGGVAGRMMGRRKNA
jgi:hypothetical protein